MELMIKERFDTTVSYILKNICVAKSAQTLILRSSKGVDEWVYRRLSEMGQLHDVRHQEPF